MIGEDGRSPAAAIARSRSISRRPGWVEHDANEILECVQSAARDAIDAARFGPMRSASRISARPSSSGSATTGRPVHRAIVWQDRRTAARCRELAPRAEWIAKRTGLVPDPYFSATKIEWLLDHERLLDRYRLGDLAVGTIDTWLVSRAHRRRRPRHRSDERVAHDAVRHRRAVVERRACARCSACRRRCCPRCVRRRGDFGVAMRDVLGVDAPILGVAGDQQAALFGQGCSDARQRQEHLRHRRVSPAQRGHRAPAGRSRRFADDDRVRRARRPGVRARGGDLHRRRRDTMVARRTWDHRETRARPRRSRGPIESTDGVYFVPALTGLGAPHWEAEARGTIVGLTRGTTSRAPRARRARGDGVRHRGRAWRDAPRERG